MSRALLLLLCWATLASASGQSLLDVGAGSLRQRSMGGCLAACSGWWDTPLGNPAALRRELRRSSWEVRLDPLSPLVRSVGASANDGALAGLHPAAAFVSRLVYASPHVALALDLGSHQAQDAEAIPQDLGSQQLPSSSLLPSLQLGLRFDRKVSLGLSMLGVYNRQARQREWGYLCGVLIQVNRMVDVGAVAVYLHEDNTAFRQLDRLAGGTINVGIQLHPLGRPEERPRDAVRFDPRLAVDVRNVTQDTGLGSAQELHAGFALGLAGRLELRGGIYWPVAEANLTGKPLMSAGFALRQPMPNERNPSGVSGPWALELGWMPHPAMPDRGIWMLRTGWVLRR